jgi:hypothetical protein
MKPSSDIVTSMTTFAIVLLLLRMVSDPAVGRTAHQHDERRRSGSTGVAKKSARRQADFLGT